MHCCKLLPRTQIRWALTRLHICARMIILGFWELSSSQCGLISWNNHARSLAPSLTTSGEVFSWITCYQMLQNTNTNTIPNRNTNTAKYSLKGWVSFAASCHRRRSQVPRRGEAFKAKNCLHIKMWKCFWFRSSFFLPFSKKVEWLAPGCALFVGFDDSEKILFENWNYLLIQMKLCLHC